MGLKQVSKSLCIRAVITALALFSSACGVQTLETIISSPRSGISAGPEPANCSPVVPTGTTITVSGSAIYYYRAVSLIQIPSSNNGLYGNPVSANIRRAEVEIDDSSGNPIQCGATDGSGNFSLTIPKVTGTYTLKILSRSPTNSSYVRVSVLEDLYGSTPYSISTSFTVNSGTASVNTGTLSARARISESSKIEGGAFFIFDNILYANDRLRTLTGDAALVAPKAQIYWKAGFNPYSYFDAPDVLSSFYINGEGKIYILGGYNGDVKSQDTDHFDPSVILHEYGHFLEDKYGRSESPGGSHSGDSVIDPRLGWSEGWGNYIQAEFLDGRYFNKKYYIDTIGFKGDTVEGGSAGTGIAIQFDLSQDGGTASRDAVTYNGEGTFRELSISRMLYKTTRTPASNVSGNRAGAVPFNAIWESFKSTSSGFGTSASILFRSIGYFNSFMTTYITANHPGNLADWQTNVLADEKQNQNRKDYAAVVNGAGACALFPKSVSPVEDEDYSLLYHSNQLLSNDFYTFYYTGIGTQTITLNYTQSGPQNIDLDLILWKSNYRYIEDEQEWFQGYSNTQYAVRSRRNFGTQESGQEIISLSGLSPGYYMLNVKALTISRTGTSATKKTTAQLNGTANYNLQITTSGTTEYLCPAQ